MMVEPNEKLADPQNHICLRCRRAVEKATFRSHESGATYFARCHGEVARLELTRNDLEDLGKLSYFAPLADVADVQLTPHASLLLDIIGALDELRAHDLAEIRKGEILPVLSERGRDKRGAKS